MAKKKAIESPDPIIAEARKNWQRCDEAEDAQRKAILEAKKFRAGDQWPNAIKLQREGAASIQGQAAQPPRPCLTVDRLSQPVRQISNSIKTANFAIDVLPNGDGADEEIADIYKGYLRRVQNQARGESPIEWAADSAIEGGIGWFRIRTEYVNEHGPSNVKDLEESIFDQELRLERITNNLTVYCDPSAMKPTRSDAQFMLVTEDMFKDEFQSRWPNADMAGLEAFESTGDMQGWVSEDTIRIAEYWKVTYEDAIYVQLSDGRIMEASQAPEKITVARTRTVRKPIVKCYKISAVEVLEQYDWVGSRIPLIPIIGEELNIDGKPVLRGVIAEGMDAQRMVNYTYSGAMEIFALGNKGTYVVAVGSIDNHKQIWDTRTIANHAYLPYDFMVDGMQVPPPHYEATEAPIQAAVQLMRTSEEAIKATTNIGDPSLGNYNPQDHSGKAIQSLQAQSDLATSLYPQNVSRALIYAGELMVEIIPKITRPGQIIHILGIDDEPDQIMVGKPYQLNPQGQPVASPVSPDVAKLSDGLHKFYDISQGRYAVTVVSGKASATKREEGAYALGELIQHLPPEMAMVATPDYVEQLSFPGAAKIAEKLRKILPANLQEGDDGQPNAKQLQQQLQQQGQIVHVLTQHVNDLTEQIKTKQLERQTQLEKADKDNAARLQIAEVSANAGIAEADIKAGNADLDRRLKLIELFLTAKQEERLDAEAKIHEAATQGREHGHEIRMAQIDHQHEIAKTAVSVVGDAALAEQQHGHALDQGQQAADLAPTPAVSDTNS